MVGIDDGTTLPLHMISGQLMRVDAGAVQCHGLFAAPEQAQGLIILAQGLNTNHSHQYALTLAHVLYQHALATFVVDLFSSAERELDRQSGFFRTNYQIMAQRLPGIAEWFLENPGTARLTIGYFGMDAAGTATLQAAAERPDIAGAVVCAGGQIDPAHHGLSGVVAPTLLITAEKDVEAVKESQDTLSQLQGKKQVEMISGATTITQDLRARFRMMRLTLDWFTSHLVGL